MAKAKTRPKPRDNPHPKPERIEPWKNTRPRANPDRDMRDVDRCAERMEMLLGH